jgi:thermitase
VNYIANHSRYRLVTTVPTTPVPEVPPPAERTEVKVAVMDNGCGGSYTAPAVTARMILPGWDMMAGGVDSTRVSNTHCAYITGRILTNSDEWVKVANVNIAMPGTSGGMYASLVGGVVSGYLIPQGFKVATLSLAGAVDTTTVRNAATAFEAAGGVLVAAVSNSNQTLPGADHAPILAVSACNADGTVWSGSDQGALVDLCSIAAGPTITTTGTDTTCATATSYAVGPVAAAVGMMFSVNPALTPANIRTILAATCVDLGTTGRDIYTGWGRLDAEAAIEAARIFGA